MAGVLALAADYSSVKGKACADMRPSTESGEVLGTEVCQFVMLPMRPEVFDGIQLRSIGWQELQVDGALLALDILAHQPTAMRLEPIPDDQQLSVAQMPSQRFEEDDDLRRPHRALHQLAVDVPEADTGDRRQLFPIEAVIAALAFDPLVPRCSPDAVVPRCLTRL